MMYLPARTVLGKISFWQKDTLELAQPSKIKDMEERIRRCLSYL